MVTNATNVKEVCGNDIGECGSPLMEVGKDEAILKEIKCLVVEIMSDKCKVCQKWERRVNDPKYPEWKANQCKNNHTGSVNSMQAAGALRIFQRSYISRGLKYKNMLGDGDSFTYNNIVESKPYDEECIPNKLECIGHVQKRVGSRLQKLKNSSKGIKLSDGKGLD